MSGIQLKQLGIGFLIAVVRKTQPTPWLAHCKYLVPDLAALHGAQQHLSRLLVTGDRDHFQGSRLPE